MVSLSRKKSPFDLKGKVCVIIGGAGLIGSEFSRLCALQGAVVVVVERNEKKGHALAKKITQAGGKAFFEVCDTTKEDSVISLVRRIYTKFKRVDGLVNTAHFGTGHPGESITKVKYADFLDYLDRHVGGPFLATREFAKRMMKQKSGSIVFMSSIYGVKAPRFEIYKGTPMTVRAEYAIAKGGLVHLVHFLAKVLGPYGIRVNAIAPGGVFDNQNPSFVREYTKYAVLGKRMAQPDDLAPALVYLLSDASKYTTGQNIVIDGGWTL
jgi:NAD(P)-dependent dehydrogenase (short-subunit alcohol dehydrogenase family)